MKLKKLTFALAIMLTTVLMLNSIGATAVTKNTRFDPSYKLDEPLRELLAQMEDDDEVDVSIWVEDVDHEAVKEEAREEILELAENGEVSTDVLILLDEVKSYAELEAKGVKEPSVEDTQKLIELKRTIYRREYSEKNAQIFDELFKDTQKADRPTPEYLGSYAPNMTMVLTKAKVLEICESELVKAIYENREEDREEEISFDMNGGNLRSYDNFNTYKTDTGITSMQSLNEGANIKIGIQEVTAVPNTTYTCFSTAISEGRITKMGTTTSNHATMILAMLTGETSSFHGIACDAKYYCTYNDYYTGGRKSAAEALLSNNVNIITMSFNSGNTSSNYGDFAMWLDHIAFYHNAHIFKSSGNGDSTNISTMDDATSAYNGIVVGATKLSGSGYAWESYSRYCNDSSKQRKPDVMAPGTSVETPIMTSSGTSFATPTVAGALALLIKSNGYMIYNPQFAKAALLSGCSHLIGSSTANSNASNQMAANAKTGVGMINVYRSRLATSDFTMCDVGVCSANSTFATTRTFTVSSADINAGKKVRAAFCYIVNQTVQSSHIGVGDLSPDIIPVVIKITAPNGNVYRSNYTNDNKQVVSFTPTVSGTYTLSITSGTCYEPEGYAYSISIHNATLSY